MKLPAHTIESIIKGTFFVLSVILFAFLADQLYHTAKHGRCYNNPECARSWEGRPHAFEPKTVKIVTLENGAQTLEEVK